MLERRRPLAANPPSFIKMFTWGAFLITQPTVNIFTVIPLTTAVAVFVSFLNVFHNAPLCPAWWGGAECPPPLPQSILPRRIRVPLWIHPVRWLLSI